jgi:Resolvase, N terminal domain
VTAPDRRIDFIGIFRPSRRIGKRLSGRSTAAGLTAIKPKLIGLRKAHWIDVIFVYEVDRLTRSLADFTKLVDLFDEPRCLVAGFAGRANFESVSL